MSKHSIRYVIALAMCLFLAVTVAVEAEEEKGEEEKEEQWVSLFNGENLDGWTPKFAQHEYGVNFKNTFRVEDGILKVCYDEHEKFNGEFGHLFYKDKFSNYRLRVEYRFVGEQLEGGPSWAFRNNGIMIHGQTPQSMAIDQSFPVSIEVQLLGGDGTNERPTGNLCTPGTHVVMDGELIRRHCTNSSSETYHGDVWVLAEVEVLGNTITHFINGEEVLSYTEPQLDENDRDARKLIEDGHDIMLTGGTISLQAESHPTEFRKIEILVFDE
jgi:hypothetical protein